jgi:hypothetical protein
LNKTTTIGEQETPQQPKTILKSNQLFNSPFTNSIYRRKASHGSVVVGKKLNDNNKNESFVNQLDSQSIESFNLKEKRLNRKNNNSFFRKMTRRNKSLIDDSLCLSATQTSKTKNNSLDLLTESEDTDNDGYYSDLNHLNDIDFNNFNCSEKKANLNKSFDILTTATNLNNSKTSNKQRHKINKLNATSVQQKSKKRKYFEQEQPSTATRSTSLSLLSIDRFKKNRSISISEQQHQQQQYPSQLQNHSFLRKRSVSKNLLNQIQSLQDFNYKTNTDTNGNGMNKKFEN